MNKYIKTAVITLVTLSLVGCASFQLQPISYRTAAATSVALTLALAPESPTKGQLAHDLDLGATILASTVIAIPTPEQLQAKLERSIPNSKTKALAITGITGLYRDQYQGLSKLSPSIQLGKLQELAQGVKDATSAYLLP